MLQRIRKVLAQNPMTPSLAIAMTLLLAVQWYVATTSTALFEFLFVAQAKLTPGLVFSPFSHAGFSHLLFNIGLLFLFGWLCEAELTNREFLGFVVVIAYVSTFTQVIVDTVTAGSAGTLGFSGVAYAFPSFFAVVLSPQLRRAGSRSQFTWSVWSSAVVVSLLIPFMILGLVSIGGSSIAGTEPAKVTHGVGFCLGLLWGVVKVTPLRYWVNPSQFSADAD